MKAPILLAKDLSKWYGEVIGLNSFDLEVNEGITGIVGPNGAGKSTLFKLAMGLIEPNKGEIYVLGQDPWQNDENLRKIGFCPDYDNLSDHSTGEDFLNYVGSLHGLEDGYLRERVNEVADLVGMTEDMGRKIAGYSKGMRQRIKLAGALVHDPDLLFLDEPLSGADPQSRKKLIESIGSLKDRGHDIIVSSHVLQEIERMTRDVALVYKGRAVATGDISEIRSLIDKRPHNIVMEGTGLPELAKRLLDKDYTVSVGFEEERKRLIVEVEKPDEFFTEISSLVDETGSSLSELYSRDDNLQAVFKYLIGGGGG